MSLIRIRSKSFSSGAITENKLQSSIAEAIGNIKVEDVLVTNQSYTEEKNEVVVQPNTPSYIKLNGAGFESGTRVIIGNIEATSVTVMSSNEILVEVPPYISGKHKVYVVKPNGKIAIYQNGLTITSAVTWQSRSDLPQQVAGRAISVQLDALNATAYSIVSGTLPPGLSLNSTGRISGTIMQANITQDRTYSFNVKASKLDGTFTTKSFDMFVRKQVTGQAVFTNPGTYSWTAPAGVTLVSVVCVGSGGNGYASLQGGAGGGGGGLGWKNNISVIPGTTYTVKVASSASSNGISGETSYFLSEDIVAGFGGGGGTQVTGGSGGGYVGDGGGYGGSGGNRYSTSISGGGGGAGGYSGNGTTGSSTSEFSQTATGGAASGGGRSAYNNQTAFSGGGVGLLGQGSSGNGSKFGGQGGSGGLNGNQLTNKILVGYGSGGFGAGRSSIYFGKGGPGAVRIIWGAERAFPSTNTSDL